MKKLIVTADDLGMSQSINKGIIESCEKGIVTSISVLSAGDAFQDAVGLLKRAGVVSVGAHLALTEVSPVLQPASVRSILGSSDRFFKHYHHLIPRIFFKTAKKREIYAELKAQIEKILDAGFSLDHISSHEHIHLIPEISEVFIYLCKEFGIPSVRCPQKEAFTEMPDIRALCKNVALGYFGRRIRSSLDKHNIKHTDHFSGVINSGKMTEERIIDLLSSLRDGTTELVCHPGHPGPEIESRYVFHKNCLTELKALTSERVRSAIKSDGIELIPYGAL